MRSLLSAAVVLAALITASPAAAITNGSPDGNRHPAVAGLVSDTQYSDGTWIYCSGTLISPTVVLTAAHCNDDGARTRVTFDSAYVDGDKTYAGTFQSDPAYPGTTSDYHDIAVIVLDQAVKGITPARLPRPARSRACPRTSSSPPSATAPTRSPTARAATSTSTTTSAASRPAR